MLAGIVPSGARLERVRAILTHTYCIEVCTTLVWEILVFTNFGKGNFLYNSICMKNFHNDILSLQNLVYILLEKSEARRRSSEETVVFAATTYTKRYGEKL